jgi:UDP-N-acetylglucosamine 2-epimerase (non-hydrolysing)
MKSKRKFLIILGTRPEAIKLIPLIWKLRKCETVELYICSSGQHREMLDGVLEEYSIVPDRDLALMKNGQSLSALSAVLIGELERVIADVRPDLVIVHGDTTTALCGALAAFFEGVAVAHIEAGLRSYDILSPFPEEFNRRTISSVASFHFAPTEAARQNLLSEGVAAERIFVVGNTAIDMLAVTENAEPLLPFSIPQSRFALVTLHRREHSDGELLSILSALCEISAEIPLILPMHKSPRVREPIKEALSGCERVILCEPLALSKFHFLMRKAYMILTDSGGIQEEATYLGKPTLVLRKVTERPEGIGEGALRLVGTEREDIIAATRELLHEKEVYAKMATPSNIYGDGRTSERICELLLKI